MKASSMKMFNIEEFLVDEDCAVHAVCPYSGARQLDIVFVFMGQ